ncbi:MAG: hypothetical protein IPH16_13905 [Haliscomenobacter sp.]|nr:hypothetical protein [Haliscomenobacter sp.]
MSIEQGFAIRSAYNREDLRANDGQMFGYFSLPQGSTWTFTVEDDTEQYVDEIKAVIVGKTHWPFSFSRVWIGGDKI